MTRILVVEDNEMNADMIIRRLKKRGFETNLAENGRIAIELARSWEPQLILMDLSLPEVDGYEATMAIKKIQPGLPIIALTAHALAEDKEKALNSGCDEYDTKPVNFERLMNKIAMLLSEQT